MNDYQQPVRNDNPQPNYRQSLLRNFMQNISQNPNATFNNGMQIPQNNQQNQVSQMPQQLTNAMQLYFANKNQPSVYNQGLPQLPTKPEAAAPPPAPAPAPAPPINANDLMALGSHVVNLDNFYRDWWNQMGRDPNTYNRAQIEKESEIQKNQGIFPRIAAGLYGWNTP